jgi:ATP-dependent exoDNAse (exonuclease V) beta subunit
VRCVLDPHDQLALLTLLRSAVVGVPDAALVPLWARELPALMADLHGDANGELEALGGLLAEAATELPDGVPGLERVAGWTDNLLAAARALALLRASFEDDPADRFVDQLRGLFFFEVTEAARYLGAYRLANLERFFRDLLTALRDGEGDPRAILRALREDVAERREAEEGRPVEAVEDAVQITTIHKAKGLAFEHVYLLQLHKGRSTQKESRVESVAGRLEYQLLGARTPGYHRVEERREALERHERVRTLYVAATRARRRLVLAGIHPEHAVHGGSRDSHVALLAERRGGRPDLAAAARTLAQGRDAHVDAAGARWVLPALREEAGERRAGRRRALADAEQVRARAQALARRRAEAAAQRERPFAAPISGLAHEVALEGFREGEPSPDGGEGGSAAHPGPSRDAAAAVGTAVHRALECLDLAADPGRGLAAQRARLEDEIVRGLAEAERPAALARAAELLERLAAGPLLSRLREIAPHVLARELPVLLAPGDDDAGPAGYWAGVVDLLYRDPASSAVVVADYKTDRIRDAADLAEKTARYARQGAGYVRAVQEALGLEHPPRFELWFLDADRIEVATDGPC